MSLNRKRKRFPLSYVLHMVSRFGMNVDSYTCTGFRLVVDTPLPSGRNRRQFMSVIHYRWPKAEVSWMAGRVMVDLSRARYKPAKGSWLEERERRINEQAKQAEALYDGSGGDSKDVEPRGTGDVCLHAVLYRPGCDKGAVQRPQSDGPRDQEQVGGEGEC